MKDDFMDVLIPYYAEIITGDMPDKTRELRFSAIRTLQGYLCYYQKLGYMEKLLKPRCPHYDGNKFVPDAFCVPEEELICWSETSLKAPLNEAGFCRYMELFSQILPAEYGQAFGKA